MPNTTKTRIPSYRLHKPTGQAVVRLNGRDFYLGKHGTTESRRRYEETIARWLVRRRSAPNISVGPRVLQQDISINELFLAYWDHAQSYYRKDDMPTGELEPIRQSMKPLARLHGLTHVATFGPLDLKTVRQAMIDADLSRKVINSRINRIRRMFKWGVENHLVDVRVLHALQAIAPLRKGRCEARETEPIKPVPPNHVNAILPYVSRQIAAMIELQLFTGMRPNEVTAIRGCDLDCTGSIWLYRPASHKTEHHGRQRVICLGPKAHEVVKQFLKFDPGAYMFSPRDAVNDKNRLRRANRKTPMTPSQARRTLKKKPQRKPGDHYETSSYGHAIARACKKAGVSRWSPNQLRHNAATFLRKEFGIEAARVILGHSSSAVTEVYAELDHTKAMEIMGKVG